MSRTKKFFYNSFSSVVMQVVTLIGGMIVPWVMLTTYGSEINGLVSSITQFISYFALVEAGLSGACIYALFEPLAKKDHRAISRIVAAGRDFYRTAGYIFTALVIALSVVYPMFVKTEYLSGVYVGLLVLIIGSTNAINFFAMAKYKVLLTADQKTYILNYLSALSYITNVGIIVALTMLGADIVLLRFIALASVIIMPAALSLYAKKHYAYIDGKARPNKQALNKRWDALILQLLGTIQTSAPIVLATVFTTLKDVSIYAIYNMVILGVRGIIAIIGTGVSASFGEVIAQKDQKTLRKAYGEFEYMLYFMMTLMFSCTMVLLVPFIKIYTKNVADANYDQPLIGFLFVLNAMLYGIKGPHGTLVTSAGLFRETKYRTLAQALIAIGVGAALAGPLGIVGILIGLIVSNIYRDIDMIIFIPKTLHNTKISKTVRRVALIFAEFSLIILPFFFIEIAPNNYLEWLIDATCVFVYALVVMLAASWVFDREAMFALAGRVRGLLRRR